VKTIFAGFIAACCLAASPSATGQTCPRIAGWVETATIASPPRAIEAKLDTGAETSALSATAIVPFTRDGTSWVRFSLNAADAIPLEAPLVRWVRVRRAGTKTDRRPVVGLALCIAGLSSVAEFTLTDRTGLDYPMLIGRSALAGRFAVDSARTHLTPDSCPR
jgi:hypothetical protein